MNTKSAPTSIPENLPAQIAELLANGGTVGSVYDYDDTDYEVLYALGHSVYSQTRYQDAMRIFGFLVTHNHMEKRFMNAFAASLQMLKSYKEAIKYYSMASLMDMGDPLPTYHTAECMIALGYTAEAKEALQFVLRQSETPERAELKSRAQAMLDLMGSNAKSSSSSSSH
ncbi:SycD/LcrH family type III secretion system chaperone [Acidovorax sp.]|uniref:SycD/LcrH family type III secretion system chaperone n=1 Tax=Acidovorax sp. TaxID=1872122 RepID=UPI00262AEC77|nr:SycD/LcrH family type III secretion system chaperone [Acidovorax sp.]